MQADFPAAIEEVMAFLCTTDVRYAIFAGFGAHLLTGVDTSSDVDILLELEADCERIAREFEDRGWTRTKEGWETPTHLNIVLAKGESEFDLVYSKHAAAQLVGERTPVEFQGKTVYALNPEAMLLVKINQMTKPDRSPEKVFRDREVINLLRGQADGEKLAALAGRMGPRYWIEGRF